LNRIIAQFITNMATLQVNSDKLWDKSAKNEFVKSCRSQNDRQKLTQIIYELCAQVINGQLRPDLIIPGLVEAISYNEDIINILSDVLLLFGKCSDNR
jgi:hypothetical protein